jgi:MFS family permease
MGIFYLGLLLGSLLTPVLGGVLVQGFGWLVTMWFLVIYGGVMVVVLLFGLPGTLKRTLQVQRREQGQDADHSHDATSNSPSSYPHRHAVHQRTYAACSLSVEPFHCGTSGRASQPASTWPQ